jgi:cysteine desulfurase
MNVYLDNNSTSRLAPEVLDAMLPYLKDKYGNASSIHSIGREAKKGLEASRETIARIIGAPKDESICFTGSGSEADNMAIRGVAQALRNQGDHIVTSAVEHPAVLNTCTFLEEEGFRVTYVKPDATGLVHAETVAEALRNDTILISIMHANNETGTINPISEIGKIARERNIVFHTDAVQTFCKLPFTVEELGVDLLSLSAHKINGPKGVGALYVREGIPLKPLIYGGHQEGNRRAGTENVAGIVGMAKAARINWTNREEETRRIKSLRDRLERGLLETIAQARLNGHPELRLPNTLNLSFPFVESESLLLELDLKGVSVSSGSACTSGTGEPSHVLLAMGIPHEICRGALRFSLGRENTKEEIDYILEILPKIVQRMQAMSPLSV